MSTADTVETVAEQLADAALGLVPALAPFMFIIKPLVHDALSSWAAKIDDGIAHGSMKQLADGSIISAAWAADPRHALNADGTFKE